MNTGIQKLDELEERITNIAGFETEIKLGMLRERLECPEFKDYMHPEVLPFILAQLEKEVLLAEIRQKNVIECGIRSAGRLLEGLRRGGEYALTRADGEPMGMSEQVYLGNILNAIEDMVKASGAWKDA